MATTREPIGYEKAVVKRYAARERTILQLAQDYSVSYEKMRHLIVKAGYSQGLKCDELLWLSTGHSIEWVVG